MIGTLDRRQCEYILASNHIARIGYNNERIIIIPITYVYDDGYIYCTSHEGSKVTAMRKSPDVTIQVDVIDHPASWRSVLAWGKFEELKSDVSQSKAKQLFAERLLPLTLGQTVDPSREFAGPAKVVQKKLKPVIFRIGIDEVKGRYEKQIYF